MTLKFGTMLDDDNEYHELENQPHTHCLSVQLLGLTVIMNRHVWGKLLILKRC